MDKGYYSVLDENNCILAEHMSIEHALLFIKALFDAYYHDCDCTYIIHKEN